MAHRTLDELEGAWFVAAATPRTAAPTSEQQIAVINARYLDLIAGRRERWPLAGDQRVVDLDLSQESLRPGDTISRVEVPAAVRG